MSAFAGFIDAQRWVVAALPHVSARNAVDAPLPAPTEVVEQQLRALRAIEIQG